MSLTLILITTPALGLGAGLTARLLGRTRPRAIIDHAHDLISLHMILRQASPSQRVRLIEAHLAWRRATLEHPQPAHGEVSPTANPR